MMMKRNPIPLYDVEFLPLERRLNERRKNLFDARVLDVHAGLAVERRHCDRRSPPQNARAA
jgi:hypothetical protein